MPVRFATTLVMVAGDVLVIFNGKLPSLTSNTKEQPVFPVFVHVMGADKICMSAVSGPVLLPEIWKDVRGTAVLTGVKVKVQLP